MTYLTTTTGNPQTWSPAIIALASVVGFIGLILLIVSIIWLVTYIKYSWCQTKNSANLSGGQLSKLYLEKYGVNAKRIKRRKKEEVSIKNINVESKFWYLRPYLLKDNTLTLRLVPWTHRRTSIYTLAKAMESTWAISSSKSNRFNTFWWDFARKITLIVILLPFIFALIFALAPFIGWSGFVVANSNPIVIGLLVIGAVFLILFSLSEIFFYGKSRKEITKNLQGILSPNEIKAISWIFKVKFIYYVVRLIYEILRFALQIVILSLEHY